MCKYYLDVICFMCYQKYVCYLFYNFYVNNNNIIYNIIYKWYIQSFNLLQHILHVPICHGSISCGPGMSQGHTSWELISSMFDYSLSV